MSITFEDGSRMTSAWHPFPTEPAIHEFDEGDTHKTYWLSPPILSGKRAHRYTAMRRRNPNGKIDRMSFHEAGPGWKGYVSRENWAASVYHDDPLSIYTFKREYDARVPQALQLKWYLPMMEFLHHDQEDVLASHRRDFESFAESKASDRRRTSDAKAAHEARFGTLEHGDLALTRHLYKFNEIGEVRAFVMLKRRSGRLKPHLWQQGARYPLPVTVRGTTLTSFMKVGPAAFEEIPELSNHERLALLQRAEEIKALTATNLEAP